jgi:mRNA interferase RelE/StbE
VKYEISIKASALKALKKLPDKEAGRIIAKIDQLAEDPRPAGCIKLSGRSDRWRVRSGTYRIIYTIEDKQLIIEVLRIRHRKDVYG